MKNELHTNKQEKSINISNNILYLKLISKKINQKENIRLCINKQNFKTYFINFNSPENEILVLFVNK